MAIPLGLVIQDIATRKFILKAISALALTFFVVLNLFQTWQFFHWIIPDDRMTYEYYKRIFFKTKVTDEDKKYEEIERSFATTEEFKNPEEYHHHTIAFYNFDDANTSEVPANVLDTSVVHSGKYSCRLSTDNMYCPNYHIDYDQLVPESRDHVWLRLSLWYYSKGNIKDNPASLVINMPHKNYNLKYRAFDFEKFPNKPGEWTYLQVDYMTPFPYSGKDHFEIYAWYRGKTEPVFIDDLKVESYVRNW